MSTDRDQADSEQSLGGAGPAGNVDTGETAQSSTICWVCQRPIADAARRTEGRGEPVHDACLAAARCGISLDDS